MKKVNFARICVIFTAVMAALIGLWACDQAQSGLDEVSGGGNGEGKLPRNAKLRVVFDFSGEQGGQSPQETHTSASVGALSPLFTIHPITDNSIFDSYKLIFEVEAKSGGENAEYEVIDEDTNYETGRIEVTVDLVEGTYTVTAEAYKNDGEGNDVLIAVGKQNSVSVTPGTTETVDITMGPNLEREEAEGFFQYDIAFPGNAAGTLRLINGDGLTPYMDDIPLNASPAADTISISPGSYFVSVALIDDSNPPRRVGFYEALHIYEDLASVLTKAYTADDFSTQTPINAYNLTYYFPAPVTNAEPVRSFDVPGAQYHGTIQWHTSEGDFNGAKFAATTEYTAVVTLTVNSGYVFNGVEANRFNHANAKTHSNTANSGVVTLEFAATKEQNRLTVTVDFGYSDIDIPGADSAIYKGDPGDSLELRVAEGYDNHRWYIDGDSSNPISGNPLILDAEDYAEGIHTASFVGTKNGMSYSQSVKFIVATAPLILEPTDKNTSRFEVVSMAGTVECVAETGWLTESNEYNPNVYFTVRKGKGQAIALSGDDEAYVAIAPDGTTVDGSTPDAETAVVTVRPKPVIGENDEMLDTQFDGGVYSFTLTSSGKSVDITLTVEPHLTGTAVFLVNAKTAGDVAGLPAGTNVLTRLGGIKKAAVTGNSLADSVSTVSATDAPTTGNYLLSALARVDRLANSTSNEYLIRVEQNEALPKVMLTCNYPASEAAAVTVRLRGLDSGARTITYDDSGLGYSFPNGKPPATTASDFGRGIITIGDARSSTYPAYITLALENNIALAGKVSGYTDSANTTAMVQVNANTKFIMRNGSRITNYYNTTGTSAYYSVVLIDSQSNERGYFEMYGGEITGNTVPSTGGIVTVYSATPMTAHFKKWGGRIYGNSSNYFFYSSDSGNKYNIPTDDGEWEIE